MTNIIKFIKKNKYILLLILLYGFLFAQMKNVFLYGDDFDVTYPMYYDRNNIIDVFRFCIDQVVYFWYEWSGRITGHFIVSFGLSFFGINFFRILNPIMVFVLIFLSLKILGFFVKFNFSKMMFFISFIFIGINVYIARETLYWAYGGILYIWGFVFFLIVVYNVYRCYLQDKKIPIVMMVILIFLSIIQIFMLEQLSFLLLSFLIVMLFGSKKEKKKSHSQILTLLILTMLGFVVFLLSPGNVVRTDPLVEELINYSSFQIILGRINVFFNLLLNPKLYGIYFSLFALLVGKKYFLMLNKNGNILKKIPLVVLISYFVIIILNKICNTNLLAFFEDLDILYLSYHGYSDIWIFIIDIYYILFILSVFYMFYETIKEKNKFLLLSFIITFFVSAVPVVCIRYIGARYFIFLFVLLLLLCSYYFLDLKKRFIDLKILFLLITIVPFKGSILLAVLIIIFILFSKNITEFFNKNYTNVALVLILVLLSCNCINIFIKYNKNANIHKKNDIILSNSRQSKDIIIYEIPYENYLYSWHTYSMDYSGNAEFYKFYLNEFYESYYGIDSQKILILTEEGDYVK